MSTIDQNKSQSLYNSELYLNNTNMWEDSTGVPRAKALVDALDEIGIVNEINSILDVGCGSGGVIRFLSKQTKLKKCQQYTGLDIAKDAIRIANELFPDSAKYGVNFALYDESEGHPAIKKSYSLVTMIHVVEHVPDMISFINKYGAQGEYIYINIPIEFTLNYVLRDGIAAKLYQKYGHLHFFDEDFFDELLIDNGYEIISRVYSLDYTGRNKGVKSNLLAVIRTILYKILGPSRANFLVSGFSYGVLIKLKGNNFPR